MYLWRVVDGLFQFVAYASLVSDEMVDSKVNIQTNCMPCSQNENKK